jgi:hypothetical protein
MKAADFEVHGLWYLILLNKIIIEQKQDVFSIEMSELIQ